MRCFKVFGQGLDRVPFRSIPHDQGGPGQFLGGAKHRPSERQQGHQVECRQSVDFRQPGIFLNVLHGRSLIQWNRDFLDD